MLIAACVNSLTRSSDNEHAFVKMQASAFSSRPMPSRLRPCRCSIALAWLLHRPGLLLPWVSGCPLAPRYESERVSQENCLTKRICFGSHACTSAQHSFLCFPVPSPAYRLTDEMVCRTLLHVSSQPWPARWLSSLQRQPQPRQPQPITPICCSGAAVPLCSFPSSWLSSSCLRRASSRRSNLCMLHPDVRDAKCVQ